MDEKVFRKQYKVDDFYINDQQKVRLYEQYKSQQEEQFELYINYINEILIILKDYRIVSDFTKMNARIKATESALLTDGLKALDDVFGIEVDFATPGEKAFVSEIIKGTLKIVKERIHNKGNGYEAYHCSGYPVNKSTILSIFNRSLDKEIDIEEEYQNYYKTLSPLNKEKANEEKNMEYFKELKENFEFYSNLISSRMDERYLEALKKELQETEEIYLIKQKEISISENIPIIEFQSKTIQVAIEANIGAARHDGYKGISSGEMQKKYDALEGKVPLSQVPTMYSSDLKRDKEGRVVPMQLRSSQKTLEVQFPGLITRRRRKRGEGESRE